MNKLAAIVLLCATIMPATAQTKVLAVKNRVPSSVAVDDFPFFAVPTTCDEQGRFYVKLATAGMVGPLLRLSAKGVLEAKFDTSGTLVNIYAVRPNGGVAMLHLDGNAKVVDIFGPDGKRESAIRLENPPIPFFPSQIAVFRSGEMLIAGVQYHPGYKASSTIYDPTGRLVKQFVLDGDAEIERAIEVGDARYTRTAGGGNAPVSRSVAITGDDGFVYLMRALSPATVYVISDSGEVVRKFPVNAPTDKGLPEAIRVVKNRLAIKFHRGCDSTMNTSSCQGAVYTIVDATTGQKLADYEEEKDAAGVIACYAPDPDRFFNFSTSRDQHHLEIVETALR